MALGNNEMNVNPTSDAQKRLAAAASIATATMALQNIIIDSYEEEFDTKMTLE